jgi:hypothetical protein
MAPPENPASHAKHSGRLVFGLAVIAVLWAAAFLYPTYRYLSPPRTGGQPNGNANASARAAATDDGRGQPACRL